MSHLLLQRALSPTWFALELHTQHCFFIRNTMDITMTIWIPAFPSNVDGITLWTFSQFREIKWMHNCKWSNIGRWRFDISCWFALLDAEIGWWHKSWPIDWDSNWKLRRCCLLYRLCIRADSSHLVNSSDILNNFGCKLKLFFSTWSITPLSSICPTCNPPFNLPSILWAQTDRNSRWAIPLFPNSLEISTVPLLAAGFWVLSLQFGVQIAPCLDNWSGQIDGVGGKSWLSK